MSGTPRAGSYRALLTSHPRLCLTFGTALVGRFGYAVLPLCLLFTVADASTFATAATASAVWGFCTLVVPVQARLIDRFGQRAVLVPGAAAMAAVLASMVWLALRHVTSPVWWIGASALLGILGPTLGPSMRAQWRVGTPDEDRTAAYSLDGVAEETVFLLGPLAAAVLLSRDVPWLGLAAVAVLIPVGALGLALSPFRPPVRDRPGPRSVHPEQSGPLRRPRMLVLLGATATTSLAASAMITWVAALADQQHRPGVMGVLETAMGVSSIVGGLLWGRLRPGGSWTVQMAALVAVRLPMLALCLVRPTLWGIGAVLVALALLTSPGFVVAFLASDEENPPEQHTEASTWLTVVGNLGSSLGTAAAGWAYERGALPAVVAALAVLLVVVLLLLARMRRVRTA